MSKFVFWCPRIHYLSGRVNDKYFPSLEVIHCVHCISGILMFKQEVGTSVCSGCILRS